MSLGHPVFKIVEMDDELRDFAVIEAKKALENSANEKLVASHLKKSFENKFKSVWHCVTGRNFGGYVTHEKNKYIYFYIGQKGFLLWSTPSDV
mmetsp:Transcript_31591/g.27986  ORF Transcript_31591/g.27986 Transcript_31591/m.27986 type:complete len:93 (+) Transcript_31591:2-280(+)